MGDELDITLSREAAHEINSILCWAIHPKNHNGTSLGKDYDACVMYIQEYANAIQR